MTFHLILIKSSPYQGRQSHEILEAIMALALFEIPHKVVFVGAGTSWCLPNQQTGKQKSLEKQLRALPMYGSEELFVCTEHFTALCGQQAHHEDIEPVSASDLSQWLRDAQHVEVF